MSSGWVRTDMGGENTPLTPSRNSCLLNAVAVAVMRSAMIRLKAWHEPDGLLGIAFATCLTVLQPSQESMMLLRVAPG